MFLVLIICSLIMGYLLIIDKNNNIFVIRVAKKLAWRDRLCVGRTNGTEHGTAYTSLEHLASAVPVTVAAIIFPR